MLRMIVPLLTMRMRAQDRIRKMLTNQQGGISLEYGLLIAVIVIGMISAASFIVGGEDSPVKKLFTEIMDKVTGVAVGKE